MGDYLIEQLKQGYAAFRSGDTEAAERTYRAVLRRDPRNVHALNLLGVLLTNSRRGAAAISLISLAVELDPTDPDARANLGLAYKDAGRLADARDAFVGAAKLAPGRPAPLNYLASTLYDLGDFEGAIEASRRVLAFATENVPALINFSRSLTQVNLAQPAEAAARQAIGLAGGTAEAWCALGDVLLKTCRYDEAISAYRRGGADLDARLGEASAHREAGDLKQAQAVLDAALSQRPDDPRVLFASGVLFEQSGRADMAQGRFTACLASDPSDAAARYQLTQLPNYQPTDDDIAAFERALSDDQSGCEQRRYAAFGLARAEEKRGLFALAIKHYAAGHAEISRGQRYDDVATTRFHTQIVEAARGFAKPAASKSITRPTPIFVVGMPRSGTSLCEQVLASHTEVAGFGECSFLQDAVTSAALMLGAPYPERLSQLTENQRRELGDTYLRRLSSGTRGERYIVDKTPLNYQYLGFAKMILPDARFVHCQRSPIDNCLSIYRLPFDRDQTYAHDLVDLAQHYRRYRALMGFWTQWLGSQMTSLQYEMVVENLEATARGLLAFLDLEFEPGVLEFHATERIVKTPSTSQVRQPIYRDSVDYWRRYGNALEPLMSLSDLA